LTPLVVATTSRYRLALLDRLGVAYVAHAHKVDERAVEPVGVSAVEAARALAVAKAESLAGDFPDALVLGSDQIVCAADGSRLGKPGSVAAACAQLTQLAQGGPHQLVTAVALRRPGGQVDTHVDVHTMYMRPLGAAQIAAYVERDQPLDCAGAYKIESLGIALFERIVGEDHTAIIGLPLLGTVRLLAAAGVEVLGS
jgi:septum formation protein